MAEENRDPIISSEPQKERSPPEKGSSIKERATYSSIALLINCVEGLPNGIIHDCLGLSLTLLMETMDTSNI